MMSTKGTETSLEWTENEFVLRTSQGSRTGGIVWAMDRECLITQVPALQVGQPQEWCTQVGELRLS